MGNIDKIDFVVTWVDDADPVWQKKKADFTGVCFEEGNCAARYRDWDTLKYWFRGVEKYAPWVNNVYFITDDQKPEWLNLNHPKLKWIKHTDYIPKEYLPTFNSNVIEWNIHRIEGLSEKFVYFNDDMFLIKDTKPKDFFVDGLPCDLPCLNILYPNGFFSYLLFNNINLLNEHFSLKESIKANPIKWIKGQSLSSLFKLLLYGRRDLIPNSVSWHIQISYIKKMFEVLWEKEFQKVHETCKNKLRTKNDISIWSVRDWQIFSGEFYPKRPIGKLFQTYAMEQSNGAIDYIKKQKGKVICLNDTEKENSFEEHKKLLAQAFQELFPEKSSYEI